MITDIHRESYSLTREENTLCDSIHGFAVKILDENTFLMRVTWESPKNISDYKNQETIRITSIDAPELYHPSENRDKEDMEWKFRGKIIKCEVKGHDSKGRLICSVVGAF